jgi:hypothetical protein
VCSKIGNEYDEVGSRARRPERKTIVGGENHCDVRYNRLYRVHGQHVPKTMHNSGAKPSSVQEASDKCQTGQLRSVTVE